MSEAAEDFVLDGPEELPEEQPKPAEVPAAVDQVGAQVDSETEPESKKSPPPLTEEQQAAVNDAIGKKVAKQREAERQAQEYQAQLAEAQRRLQQYEAPVRPDIPPPPDPYDDDFQIKVAHRDAMIARAAQFDAQLVWQQQQEQARQQQAAMAERERVNKVVETYSGTASKLGITPEELQTAGAQIAPLVTDRLALRILNDAQGPEITTYLARNLMELDKLAHMEPEDAAVYLETTIKPKAKRAPMKLPPDPTENLSGAGMKESSLGPEGATYE